MQDKILVNTTATHEVDIVEVPSQTSAQSHEKNLNWFRDTFRPHFDKWIIGPIDRLVSSDDALIGFILMSCAIDYLAGFWRGQTKSGETGKNYREFVDEYFPKSRYQSNDLYDSLRNGLVHMFSIRKKKYALKHNRSDLHLEKDTEERIILNARNFRDDLVNAKDSYFNDVEKSPKLFALFKKRYDCWGFLYLVESEVVDSESKEL